MIPNSPSVGVPPSQAVSGRPGSSSGGSSAAGSRRSPAGRRTVPGHSRCDPAPPPPPPPAPARLEPQSAPGRVPARHSCRARRDIRSSNPCRQAVTGSSSPPAPSSTTSSSGCGPVRSQVPDGDLAAVVAHAVSETLTRLEARRFAKTSAPRKALSDTSTAPASRHVPAAVRRAVRDRTVIAAASWTREVGAAPKRTGSSSTIGIPSGRAETTIRETSACSAGRTTSWWRVATTACSRRPTERAAGRGIAA